jgi:hypothetical protein
MQADWGQAVEDTSSELLTFTLGTVDERMIILVDIERLMTSRDMELIEAAEAGAYRYR